MMNDEECWFVQPTPAFCVKFAGEPKIFVNVCVCDQMPMPNNAHNIDETKLAEIVDSGDPGSFTIPMCIGEIHCEFDKANTQCSVVDVSINKTFHDTKVRDSELFTHFMVLVSIDAILNKHEKMVDLNSRRTQWTILKNRRHIGVINPQRIRKQAKGTLVQEIDSPNSATSSPITIPSKKIRPNMEYKLWTKTNSDGKPVFECVINLKNNISNYILKCNEDTLNITNCNGSDILLTVYLPALIQNSIVTSKYDTSTRKLVVILPLQEF